MSKANKNIEETAKSNDTYKLNLALQGVTAAALALVAFLLILIVSNNNVKEFDITSQKRFTLSPFSVKTVESLQQPVEFIAFVADTDDEGRRNISDVLDNFVKVKNSKITYRFTDPRKNSVEASEMGVKAAGDIIVKYGDKKTSHLFDVSEGGVVSLLISISNDKKSTIHFLTGHGERSFEKSAASLSKLNKEMTAEGYTVAELNLAKLDKVPDEVANLAIIAPKLALLDKEREMIEKWLEHGGNLLLALEPESGSNFDWLLKAYGLKSKDELIIDPKLAQSGVEPIFVLTNVFDQSCPFTKGMSPSMGCMFKTVRPVDPDGTSNPVIKMTAAVKSDVTALACRYSDIVNKAAKITPERQQEQMPIIQAAERQVPKTRAELEADKAKADQGVDPEKLGPTKTGRAVFTGDADFMSDELFDAAQFTNKDLVMNMIGWLSNTGDDFNAAIRAKDQSSAPLMLSSRIFNTLSLVICLVLPAAVFFFGLSVVKRRG